MKVLSYQSTSAMGDVPANLERMDQICKAAALLSVDAVVFPELFLTGYNIGDQVHDLAETRDGPSIKRAKEIARSNELAIVFGYPETHETGTFNSAIAIDATGAEVGHHRKVHLFGGREKQLFQAGSSFETFKLKDRTCALAICYDIEFPEVARKLKRQNAEIIFAPTANMIPYLEVPTILAPSRALENGVVIVYANLSGSEADQEYTGLSAIIGPDGKDLARAGKNEAILIADLDDSLSKNETSPMSSQLEDLV